MQPLGNDLQKRNENFSIKKHSPGTQSNAPWFLRTLAQRPDILCPTAGKLCCEILQKALQLTKERQMCSLPTWAPWEPQLIIFYVLLSGDVSIPHIKEISERV